MAAVEFASAHFTIVGTPLALSLAAGVPSGLQAWLQVYSHWQYPPRAYWYELTKLVRVSLVGLSLPDCGSDFGVDTSCQWRPSPPPFPWYLQYLVPELRPLGMDPGRMAPP